MKRTNIINTLTKGSTFWKIGGLLFGAISSVYAAVPDYFRFEPGSTWVYRAEGGTSTFTVQVGVTGVMHNGHAHYRLSGYAAGPLLVYRNEENGALYFLDNDSDQDRLLTSVEYLPGAWFYAPKRPCDQEGSVQQERQPHTGPSGAFVSALTIQYRAFGCADAGVEQERYVENVGMVSRTVQTITGPVSYHLVHANVGTVTISESPSAAFRVGVRRSANRLVADLRLMGAGSPIYLTFPTSQEYEVVLRDSNGSEVWRWGADKFFEEALKRRSLMSLSREVEIPINVNGQDLGEGDYTVEAWLTTIEGRQFSAAVRYTHILPPADAVN